MPLIKPHHAFSFSFFFPPSFPPFLQSFMPLPLTSLACVSLGIHTFGNNKRPIVFLLLRIPIFSNFMNRSFHSVWIEIPIFLNRIGNSFVQNLEFYCVKLEIWNALFSLVRSKFEENKMAVQKRRDVTVGAVQNYVDLLAFSWFLSGNMCLYNGLHISSSSYAFDSH